MYLSDFLASHCQEGKGVVSDRQTLRGIQE